MSCDISKADMTQDNSYELQNDECEPPETPAPIFALRAFKQAIFGTPKLEDEPQARRLASRSRSIRERPASKPSSHAPRRRSVNDLRPQKASPEDAPDSPAKRPGILLTPGTGGQRRKTVSFGSDAQRPSKDKESIKAAEANPDNTRRTSLALRLGHDDKQDTLHKPSKFQQALIDAKSDENDVTLDMSAPRSTSGRYWKSEFESFSAKSAEEMRKLAKKEQLAKKFAKHKDAEATEMFDELEKERRSIALLEKQVEEYLAKLENATLQTNETATTTSSTDSRSAFRAAEAEVASLRKTNQKLEKALDQAACDHESYKKATNEQLELLKKENERLRAEAQEPRGRPTRSPAKKLTQGNDIWADAAGGSSLLAKSPVRLRKPTGTRSPLQPRTDNIQIGEEKLRQDKETRNRDSNMTDERRAAARKRLEARRAARGKDAVGV